MSVDIAKLNIQITDNATDTVTSINNLADALEKLKGTSASGELSAVNAQLSAISGNLSGLERMKASLASTTTLAKNLAKSLSEVNKYTKTTSSRVSNLPSANTQQMGDSQLSEVSQIQTPDISETTTATQALAEANKEVAETAKQAADATKKESEATKSLHFHASKLKNILPGVVTQLGRMVKMRILRTMAKAFLSGITEGLQNVYYWAKAVGDTFAGTMDNLATSANWLKNSVGAAFASLINAVAPHIIKLIDLIVDGINYVNMFFAVLSGSDTYVRAKKYAVEYGKAASGAIGGATGAAKDLKEALTVLDFDELHQLQKDAESGGSGGGGGGTGGGGTAYKDMFERAKVENNWLTRTAGWLRDNFADVLSYVKAIGAGILTWKVTNAFSDVLKMLTNGKWNMTRTIGLSLMVGGTVLAGEGGFGLGHDGINLADSIKTSLGIAVATLGGTLAFGPAGAIIGLTVSIGWTIFQYIKGYKQKAAEIVKEYHESQEYQRFLEEMEKANAYIDVESELRVHISEIEYQYSEKLQKAEYAQQLLDELKKYNNVEATADNIAEVQRLTNELNASGVLGNVEASWANINGLIVTNISNIQDAIDQYKAYAKEAVLQEYYIAQQKALIARDQAQADYDTYYSQYEADYGKYKQAMNWLSPEVQGYITGVAGGWKPGDVVNEQIAGSNPELYRLMLQINDEWSALSTYQQTIDQFDADVNDWQTKIDLLIGATEENTGAINNNTIALGLKAKANLAQATGSNVDVAGGKAQISSDTGRFLTPQSIKIENGIAQQKEWNEVAKEGYKEIQNGLNIYADYNRNINTQKKSQQGATTETKKATDETNKYNTTTSGTVKVLADSHYAWKQSQADMGGFKSGVTSATSSAKALGTSYADMVAKIKTSMSGMSTIGDNMAKFITKSLNGIGASVNPKAIMNSIINAFYNTTKTANFTYIGKAFADGITDAIKSQLNTKNLATTVQTSVNGVTYTASQANVKIKAYAYASGGYPTTGELYLARENGSEMVGRIGSRNAVANNDQIADALARALRPMLSGGSGTTNVTVKMDSATVAKASMKGQKALNRQYNIVAQA